MQSRVEVNCKVRMAFWLNILPFRISRSMRQWAELDILWSWSPYIFLHPPPLHVGYLSTRHKETKKSCFRAIDTGSPHHLSIYCPVNDNLFVASPILVCAKKFIYWRLFLASKAPLKTCQMFAPWLRLYVGAALTQVRLMQATITPYVKLYCAEWVK